MGEEEEKIAARGAHGRAQGIYEPPPQLRGEEASSIDGVKRGEIEQRTKEVVLDSQLPLDLGLYSLITDRNRRLLCGAAARETLCGASEQCGMT